MNTRSALSLCKLRTFIYLILLFGLIVSLPTIVHAQSTKGKLEIYAKSNLVAWCIVPFDNKNRTPEERALMLKKLGITKLAYDWREKHIPTFDQELDALKKHEIKLQAFWYSSGLEPEKDKNLQLILDLLKRHQVKTQIWCMIGGKELDKMNQGEKVKAVAKPVAYIANKAAEIGCSLGLYNHGGWFGEPESQIAIIDYLKLPNIGIVYNFSHAEYQILDRGNIESNMMRIIKESTYRGPIGIINEDFAPDAEVGLQLNIGGLKQILSQSGDKAALKSYQ